MNASISGQAALAIIRDRGKQFVLKVDDDIDSIREIRDNDAALMFRDCTDVYNSTADTIDEVRAELELAWAKDRALHLTLILLDSSEEPENRILATECLDELFQTTDVQRHVSYFLYAARFHKAVTFAQSPC